MDARTSERMNERANGRMVHDLCLICSQSIVDVVGIAVQATWLWEISLGL